ncbi:MAG TPA: SigE family RNA polymerase sigma factor [Micromonosporaceae bacterium]|nr:SigE family RNA polymerase sigma factor [Micromonosporaceae bacterium]
MNATDTEAFREFVVSRSPALLRTAYLLVGDRDRAEDLLQTALVKTYLAWRRIRDTGAVEAYTRRVLMTTATSWWRRRTYLELPGEVPDSLSQAAADAIDERLDRDTLWPHLLALPARQRAVLVCRFYEHMTLAETAETLGFTVGTAKSHLARALATLREDDLPHAETATGVHR